MNELEKALASEDNHELDFYLESVSTEQFRAELEEIKRKASEEKEATRKLDEIISILK
jgi:hypothetical protein